MSKNKIFIFLTVFFLIALNLFSDWEEEAKKCLRKNNIGDPETLISYLETGFENIQFEDRGKAALILAFLYYDLQKNEKSLNFPICEKMSFWLDRHFKEFSSIDYELPFLSPEVGSEIIKFRDDYINQFPFISKIYLIKSPSAPEKTKEKITIQYFIEKSSEIFVDLNISKPCECAVYDASKHLLRVNSLSKGGGVIGLPISNDFLKGNEDKKAFFYLLLANGNYRNLKRIDFDLTFKYPENVKFDPRTGAIELGSKIFQQESKIRTIIGFNKVQFKKYALPNLAAGVGLILLNSLATDNLYKSQSSTPFFKANLDGSRIAINLFSLGFGLKGLYNLFAKKVFYKKIKYETVTKTPEEIQEEETKQINSIKEKIFVIIQLKPLKAL